MILVNLVISNGSCPERSQGRRCSIGCTTRESEAPRSTGSRARWTSSGTCCRERSWRGDSSSTVFASLCSPRGPYDDAFGADGLLEYRYRGTDAHHRDNVGLREALDRRLPLVYFHGIVPGKYVAAWPVFIVGDRLEALTFSVAVDDADHVGLGLEAPLEVHDSDADGRRRYITSIVRQRLHQRTFRERVLAAYRSECAFCRFRHEELLDAAHIIPDVDPAGEPRVTNGLALCKLHHAAFDRGFLGVRPDYVLQVRPDLLEEEDGPTLVHSIQSLHATRIHLPRHRAHWPARERLAERYGEFLKKARGA